MSRALRIFPLVAAPFLGIYLLGFALSHAEALPLVDTGRGAALATYLLAAAVMSIAASIGIAIVSAAGVIALVATIQGKQHTWAILLTSVLALFFASVCLLLSFRTVTELLTKPLLSWSFYWVGDAPLLAVALATLTGTLVLLYSFFPVQSASNPTDQPTTG